MIRAITAGRAGIISNPTDGYGGKLVACSIKNKAVITIGEHDELLIENTFGKTTLRWKNDFDNQNGYFDIVRCVLRQLKCCDLKAKISSTSTIPVQAGLAGSTLIAAGVDTFIDLDPKGKGITFAEAADQTDFQDAANTSL